MITRPRPEDIAPLDPDEFIGTYEYAAFVAEYDFLEEIPSIGKSVVITDVGELTLTNVFDNRFGLAAVRHFRNEGQKFLNFMWRVFALLRILEDPSLKEYIRESSDHREVHRAVFEVAATQRLSDDYMFASAPFFTQVRRVAKDG
jgi:hypothetical protein